MNQILCLTLCLSALLTTISGDCGYQLCRKTDPKKLNIHLIAHSHDDVGWELPADYLYDLFVRTIINSVVKALQVSPERKFTQVEMYFFHRWWREQNDTTKLIVRGLIEKGQLVFSNGGWTVNDEGAAHYNNIIDQMTLGLRFLNDTFGKCGHPKVSWQIDPFGASKEMPSLYAQMGFDAHVFSRGPQKGEFVWKGSSDLNTKIFTTILHDHYVPMAGFDFDKPEDALTEHNSAQKADYFSGVARKYNADYGNTNHVMIPMGTDFRYEVAENWFGNMDKLIKAIKGRHQDIDIFYTTPNCYINSIHSLNKTFAERDVDYLTYWTGYYSNRPALKYQDRITNNLLQVSKQLDVLARLDPGKTKPFMDEARNQVAVLTHHDAITGTSPQKTADDYTERLQSGYSAAKAVVRKALYYLKNKQKTISSEIFCDSLNITECSLTETNDKIAVTVYNPIARPIAQYIRLPVVDGEYQVYDSKEQKVPQKAILPVSDAVKSLPERHSKATNELVFKVNLPALGFTTYFIERTGKMKRSVGHLTRDKRAAQQMKGKSFTLEVDETTGALNSITINGKTHKLHQTFKWYKPSAGQGREESGSYNFCPNGTAHDYEQQILISKHTSGGVHEVNQQFSDHIKQTVRTYEDEDYIEFDWTVGPIPENDGLGREIITRFETDLKTDNIFYTDANGRQTIKRRFDSNRKGCSNVNSVVNGNWYPIYSRVGIRDEKEGIQLNVLTDRTQGGSSLSEGQVELMVHRRLTHNGNGGDFKVDETGVDGKGLIVRGRHYVYFGPTTKTIEETKKRAESLYIAPIVMFDKYSTIKEYSSQKELTFEALSHSLPENIHLLTLENWRPNQVLLRLEHTFEASVNSPLSKPVDLNLENLFKTFKVLDSVETTLAVNELLDESKRLNWNSHYFSSEELARNTRAVNTKVTLHSQQIRTFILTVEKNNHKEEKCSYNWVNTTQNTIPSNAFIGGVDPKGEPIFICRYRVNSVPIAGKLQKHLGCVLTSDGNVIVIQNKTFEVLIAKNVDWVPRHGTDPVPEQGLVVSTKTNGGNTFVGRTVIDGIQVIGKIDYFFYYSSSGEERKHYHNHEILTCA